MDRQRDVDVEYEDGHCEVTNSGNGDTFQLSMPSITAAQTLVLINENF